MGPPDPWEHPSAHLDEAPALHFGAGLGRAVRTAVIPLAMAGGPECGDASPAARRHPVRPLTAGSGAAVSATAAAAAADREISRVAARVTVMWRMEMAVQTDWLPAAVRRAPTDRAGGREGAGMALAGRALGQRFQRAGQTSALSGAVTDRHGPAAVSARAVRVALEKGSLVASSVLQQPVRCAVLVWLAPCGATRTSDRYRGERPSAQHQVAGPVLPRFRVMAHRRARPEERAAGYVALLVAEHALPELPGSGPAGACLS